MDQLSIPEVIPKTFLVPPQTPHPDTTPLISQEPTTTPKPLTAECLQTLLQMQKTDPFCKCVSRRLLNGKAPHHEFDTFTHVRGLLYKHIIGCWKEISHLGHSQILEIHSTHGSS